MRQIQVLIGPLKDFENGNTAQAISLVTTGRDDEFKINFTVSKSIVGTPNEIALTLTNLSLDTRQKIQRGTAIEVFYGYVGEELKRVGKGGVLSCVSVRNGTEIETTMNILDGFSAVNRSIFNRSFAGKVPVQSLVTELANNFEGISLGEINVQGVLADKGRVITGAVFDSLNTLADNFDFSWSIQDGIFQAIDDKQSTAQVYVLDSEDNLISITPILNGNLFVQIGVEITAVMDPRIKPGDRVRVKSRVNPDLDGEYKVTECQLSGSSHDDNAVIQIKSLKTF